MRIFRVLLDEDLDRALGYLDSERDVNVSAWVRSLLRAGLAEHQGDAAPVVALLPETPPTNAPPLRSWSPNKLDDGHWSSSCLDKTEKLPENLVYCSIERREEDLVESRKNSGEG